MPLAPGTTIGRYRIESRIGGGAMGVVYLARDERLERRVALKLIEPSLAADPDFRARFEREARAAAGLDHPHVLPVYEAGEEDDQLYLAMRYVPGTDLATQLARHGPLDLPATTRLVSQLAAALDAAHATGLIHRDVLTAYQDTDVGSPGWSRGHGSARRRAAKRRCPRATGTGALGAGRRAASAWGCCWSCGGAGPDYSPLTGGSCSRSLVSTIASSASMSASSRAPSHVS